MRPIPQGPGAFVVGVRNHHRPVQKEGAPLVFRHKPQPLLGKQIVRVVDRLLSIATPVLAHRHHDIRERLTGFIAPQVVGKVIVGVMLIQVAVELIEPMLPRQARLRLPDIPQPPLPKQRGPVACRLQDLGHRDILRLQRLRCGIGLARIASHSRAAMMLSGHQHAARRRTNGRSRIKMGEAKALGRHLVQVWCLDHLLAIAAQVTPAEVIRQNEDQIGFLHRCGGAPSGHGCHGQQPTDQVFDGVQHGIRTVTGRRKRRSDGNRAAISPRLVGYHAVPRSQRPASASSSGRIGHSSGRASCPS